MGTRIAIVGNGVIGLSLAYALSRRTNPPDIEVYGRPDLAADYAGSAAAPAMINVVGEVTASIETSWAAKHMLDIGLAAQAAWPEFVARLNGDAGEAGGEPVQLHSGTYIISRPGKQDEASNLSAIRKTLVAEGIPHECVKPNEIAGTAIAAPERFESGIFVPSESFVDADSLLTSLRACLNKSRNVAFRPLRVHSIEPNKRQITDERGDAHETDAVILANSCGFNDLVGSIGLAGVPHMLPIFGVGMRLSRPCAKPICVRTPVYGASCGDYAVHFPGHVYVGASALANTHRVEITSHLQRSLEFFNPVQNLNGVSLVGGIRAMSQDTYPVIGKLCDGVWAASGFFKSGVTLAPYVAELLMREVMGEAVSSTNKFKPVRVIEQRPPAFADLVRTILHEIEESATSAGSRASIRKYRWLVRLLLIREVKRVVRGLRPAVYYNSDIVQKCLYDEAVLDDLNRYDRDLDSVQ
jgi:glycine oxidase